MPTPPVYHPREVNYERRVRVGLALVAAGMVLPLTAEQLFGGGVESMLCSLLRCPQGPAFGLYLLAAAFVVGATLWWWTRPEADTPRGATGAELVALFGLVGWWAVVPAHSGLLLVVAGGFLAALGTGGLFDGDREETTLTTRLTGSGGVVVWAGFLSVALLGDVPYAVPLVFLPVLVVYLVLCASPLSWRRAHLLVFLTVVLVAMLPWEWVDPTRSGPGIAAASTATGTLTRGPDSLPEKIVLLCTAVGVTLILTGALGEIVMRTSPSLAERVRPDRTEA
jgi:hypothetical protein